MSLSTSGAKFTADPESLAQAAIAAALTSQWQEAVKINGKILTLNKGDVEALNRLARAWGCLGQIQKAQNIYKKVLALDPYNIIALKNMEKLAKSNGSPHETNNSQTHSNGSPLPDQAQDLTLAQVFLDEPGKTKLVSLLNLAPPSTLAAINCGDRLNLVTKNHAITVTSPNGIYLGAFPDDLAHRLLTFISGGNEYEAFVKSSTTKNLIIMIRETVRSAKFGNQPSFASKISLFDEDGKAK